MLNRSERIDWLRGSATALLAGAVLLAGLALTCPAKAQGVNVKNYVALGVYWPWETTSQITEANLPAFLTTRLADLAAHGVNTIWTTNGPNNTADLATLCSIAHSYGIEVIAGSGWWYMETGNESIPSLLSSMESYWSGEQPGPLPLAFSISDEPQTSFMSTFGNYASQVVAAGLPATTVTTWGNIPSLISDAPMLPFIAEDNYPFFGSPNGPTGNASYSWYTGYMGSFIQSAQAANIVPWAMPQAYQEIDGPGEFDANGNAIVLPGGGNNYLMPTDAQISWEAWSSVALGAKGVLFFCYSSAGPLNPNASPLNVSWEDTVQTPTDAPLGLESYPAFNPSAQYTALGTAFSQIAPLSSVLPSLQAVTDTAPLVQMLGTAQPGDLEQLLENPSTGQYYMACVASPAGGSRTLEFQLDPRVLQVTPLGGAPAPVSVQSAAAPYTSVTVTLQPGQGGLYQLTLGPAWTKTILLSENFSSSTWASRTVAAVNVNAVGTVGSPRTLEGTVGEANTNGQPYPSCACYVQYNIQSLLAQAAPPAPAGAVRNFEYSGFGGPGDLGLGVFVWAGPTLSNLTGVSSSISPQYWITLTPSMDYFNIAVSYREAAPAYAGLTSWDVAQWQPPAPPAAPTGVSATAAGTTINLSWAATTNAVSYNIYRGTTSGGEGATPIATVNNGLTYSDANLVKGTTYYYSIAGVNAGGVGANSIEVSAITVQPAPTGLSATAGNAQVTLSWNEDPGLTTNNLYRGTTSGGENPTPIATGIIAIPYTDTTAANGTTYYYTVTAVNTGGVSGASNEASAMPEPPAPSAPTSLSATPSGTTISLSWTASSGATSYNIYRGTASGGESGTAIATGVTTTSYRDTGLSTNTTYYYYITAVNGGGTSPHSSEVHAITAPSAPTGLAATGGSLQVALTWTAASGATSYNVYRGTTSGGESATALATGITGASYTDTTANASTKYYYTVASVGASGVGPQSSEASATTLDPIFTAVTLFNDGAGPWGNNQANTAATAYDSNTSTFYDCASASTGYTGIDLGPGNVGVVTSIQYYARSTFASRMIGGIFEGSNSQTTGYVTLGTVATASDSSWTTIFVTGAAAYRYLRYRGPANGYCNVAEVRFQGVP